MIDEILVATDLSRASRHSYPWAAGIARALKSRVTVLHVDEVSPTLPPTDGVGAYLDQLWSRRDELLAAARQQFEGWRIKTRVETCKGVASRRILAMAKRRKVGLVVVSKSGGRVFEPLLFGSTTKRVLRSARLPVLVVHQPPTQGVWQNEPIDFRRLMITTDLNEEEEPGVAFALELGRRLCANESLLTHVVRLPLPTLAEKDLPPPDGSLDLAQRKAALALERFVERFDTDKIQPRLLAGSAVAQTLSEAANSEDIDLLIVPSHAREPDGPSVGDTAESLLRRVTRPVLVLPWRYLDTLE